MTSFSIDEIGNDILDARDILNYIQELNDAKDEFIQNYLDEKEQDWNQDDGEFNPNDFQQEAEESWENTEEGEALNILKDLENELTEDEPTLIHESYFTDYCKDLCEDIGDIPKSLPSYIENNINWRGGRF